MRRLTQMLSRLSNTAIVLGCLAFTAWAVFGYIPLIQNQTSLGKEIEKVERDILLQERENELLSLKLDAVKNDPATIERLARENLRMARPGENVIRFKSE